MALRVCWLGQSKKFSDSGTFGAGSGLDRGIWLGMAEFLVAVLGKGSQLFRF